MTNMASTGKGLKHGFHTAVIPTEGQCLFPESIGMLVDLQSGGIGNIKSDGSDR